MGAWREQDEPQASFHWKTEGLGPNRSLAAVASPLQSGQKCGDCVPAGSIAHPLPRIPEGTGMAPGGHISAQRPALLPLMIGQGCACDTELSQSEPFPGHPRESSHDGRGACSHGDPRYARGRPRGRPVQQPERGPPRRARRWARRGGGPVWATGGTEGRASEAACAGSAQDQRKLWTGFRRGSGPTRGPFQGTAAGTLLWVWAWAERRAGACGLRADHGSGDDAGSRVQAGPGGVCARGGEGQARGAGIGADGE